MNFPKELKVPPQKEPLRLDKFLILQFPMTSRRFWREHLREILTVDGKDPKKALFLSGGELLRFKREEMPGSGTYPADAELKIQVVEEDPSFLVVEKPSGIPSHPLKPSETGTLIQGVLAAFPEIAGVGDLKREPGLVHRLDTDTSGLVLVARTEAALRFFREEFRMHRVEKEYLALVLGEVKGEGKIEIPIAHHPKNKRKMKVVKSPRTPLLQRGAGGISSKEEGRQAVTFYSVEKGYSDATLLKIRIPTGVRHQIRVHLASLGHPILGDLLYGGEKARRESLSRIFLHACLLVFRHPVTLKRIECRSSLPQDLKEFLLTGEVLTSKFF
jgi:23S rRNA pseudouridine1911/1915/1917 synthase